MKGLNSKRELDLLSCGYQNVFGIDEAGRGSWAGPVVAACVRFDRDISIGDFVVNDSKLLTSEKRDIVFDWLIKNFDYGVGIVSNKIIDKIGILPATRLAMKRAVIKASADPDYLLIDAVDLKKDLDIFQDSIIKGDQKIWSIAAASIIAKVSRDRLMIKYHKTYGNYCFDEHKGYGTTKHQNNLRKFGICEIHRKSYRPIKEVMSD